MIIYFMITRLISFLSFFFLFLLFCFVFAYMEMQKNALHLEALSCRVLYDSIKIGGHIEVVPIHVGQDQGFSREGLLYHIQAFIGQGKLSSVIRHGLVMLFQDQVAFFKDSRSNFLVECSLNSALVLLSMAHCGHALLIYHVQLLISGTGLFSF